MNLASPPCDAFFADAQHHVEQPPELSSRVLGRAESAAGKRACSATGSLQGDTYERSSKHWGGQGATLRSQDRGSFPFVESQNQLFLPKYPNETIGEYGDRLGQYITHLGAQERYQDPVAAAELDQEVEKWLIQPFEIMIKDEKANLQQRQERMSASCARVSALIDSCEAMITQAVSGFESSIGGVSKFVPRPVQSAERRKQPEDVIGEGEAALTGMQRMVEHIVQRASITSVVKQA